MTSSTTPSFSLEIFIFVIYILKLVPMPIFNLIRAFWNFRWRHRPRPWIWPILKIIVIFVIYISKLVPMPICSLIRYLLPYFQYGWGEGSLGGYPPAREGVCEISGVWSSSLGLYDVIFAELRLIGHHPGRWVTSWKHAKIRERGLYASPP